MIGEWAALPLAASAGSTAVGDAVSETFLYPVAQRLIAHCDAVLRIEGESQGADEDVRLAASLGKPVYRTVDALPTAE